MNECYIQLLVGYALKLASMHGWHSSANLHQTANGWAGFIKDELHDQEYMVTIIAVKDIPATPEKLLQQNGLYN